MDTKRVSKKAPAADQTTDSDSDVPASLRYARQKTAEAQARLAAAAVGPEQSIEPNEPPVQFELWPWPEKVRAVPNGFLRSALFGAVARGAARALEREDIASQDGIDIKYTGLRLDQGDLDAWECILHAVRTQSLGAECRVTAYALLKLMGKDDTGKNRETLHKRITRLRGGTIELRHGRYTYIGGLIGEAAKDEKTKSWIIKLNPRLAALYGDDEFTQVDWTVRQSLERKTLAKWLHGFYASHAEPFPLRVETLRRLCGSETDDLHKFSSLLKIALEAVRKASREQGLKFDFRIESGLVQVFKDPSSSQARHLTRKAAEAAEAAKK